MKTKIFFLIILVAFATNNLFSQDVILMRDGSLIKGKVIEFQDNLVKYKPFDFLEGPTRSVSISNVAKITYENGRIENYIQVEVPKEVPVQAETPRIDNQPSSQKEATTKKYYPVRAFFRFSGQLWHNKDLSDFFGTNLLGGVGIEKQVFDHIVIGADVDFVSKTKDEITMRYAQYGGYIKFSWATFSSGSPLLYSQIGVRGLSLQDIEADFTDKATGVGFSFLLGLEIPIGKRTTLNLAWDTVLGNVTYQGEQINMGSEIFSGGLVFSF
jgi:hypothetical protein